MDGALKGKVDSVIVSYFNVKPGGVKELNDKNTYVYNAKGLLVEDRTSDYDSNDSRQFKTTYSYDDKGNYKEVLDYNLNGEVSGRVLYSFDAVKRVVETTSLKTITGRMQLDKAGNIIEDITYQEYPVPFTTFQYKYNKRGLCVERYQTWVKSTDSQKITYMYNANNNLIKEIVINDGKLLVTKTYSYPKYDRKGNWLIQNTYRDGLLEAVGERKITYK